MLPTDQTNSIFGSGIATLNPSMPVSNDGILSWLNANPNATDATIAQTMQQYGVTPDQMAQATGMNAGDVTQRYNTALGIDTSGGYGTVGLNRTDAAGNVTGGTVGDQNIQSWLNANPAATDLQIAQTMQQYGVTPQQMATATGLDPNVVLQRYNSALGATSGGTTGTTTGTTATADPIQTWLAAHPNATDTEIVQAMQQYGVSPEQVALATGLDLSTTNQRYNDVLTRKDDIRNWLTAHPNATDTEIAMAMNQYGVTPEQMGFATGLDNADVTRRYETGNLKGQFLNPADSTDPYTGILSGFKYVHDKNISDADLRTMLGDEDYNKYKQGFNKFAKDAATGIMEDSSLSFVEAADMHKFAKDYGLTNEQLATMTGYSKELFDKIDQGFNTGLATLVGKFGGDISTATPTELKTNIGLLLGTQKKYGLTDADLAAASGGKYTEADVKGFLDPIRDVGKTVSTLSSDPYASSESLRTSLQDLKNNPYIGALYGDKLDSLIATASKDYSGNYGGKEIASMNPLAVSNVLSQLTSQRDAAAQAGTNLINGGATGTKDGGMGSADAVLEDMAKNLVASGITDIRQVGKGPVLQQQNVVEQYTYNGSPVKEIQNDYGGSTFYSLVGDGEAAVWTPVPKDSLVKSKGYISGGVFDQEGTFKPLTEEELKTVKDGKAMVDTGAINIINKETGKPLLSNYSERTGGNMWSGTFAGDGNTGYGVQFDKNGTPIFYTQGASSSSAADLAPLLTIASFIPGAQPFAMAANAALAASQGNYLGALASLTGAVPGLSEATGIGSLAADTASTLGNVSKGLSFADAINRGDYLGAFSTGANLGGFGDIKIGDTGFTLGQALKSTGILSALDKGNYLGAAAGAADLSGTKTIPGTDIPINDLIRTINIGNALFNIEKDPAKTFKTIGSSIIGKAAGGLLHGVTPDKVRASAQNMDPAYFRGIASNLRTA